VESILPLHTRGQRPTWGARGESLAFDRVDALGYSRLYIADSDGRGARCLTCEPYGFRRRHTASATWHPSGEYLVFHAEEPVREADRPLPFRKVPGGNRGESLWAITRNGRVFWDMTPRGAEGIRFSEPRFSPEGGQLLWSERIASGGGAWGRWSLNTADFAISRGTPRLKNIRSVEPGPQRLYIESCDFTRDQKGALFAAPLEVAQSEMGLDLYELTFDGGAVRQLTHTPDELDRFARFSPNGKWVAWVSNRGIPGRQRDVPRAAPIATASDLWLMPAAGADSEAQAIRLTHFSDVFSSSYTGKMAVGPPAWHPEGDRLVVEVAPLGAPEESELYVIRFKEPIGR
jgi:hypothetical protein